MVGLVIIILYRTLDMVPSIRAWVTSYDAHHQIFPSSDPCSVHSLAYLLELLLYPVNLYEYIIYFRLKQFILIWIIISQKVSKKNVFEIVIEMSCDTTLYRYTCHTVAEILWGGRGEGGREGNASGQYLLLFKWTEPHVTFVTDSTTFSPCVS